MAELNRENMGSRPPNSNMLRRTLFLMIVCGIVAFIVLVGRLYKVMIIDHEKYETAAIEQQVRETTVDSGRGSIYDRNMNILAMSASADTIYISPAEIVMYEEDPVLISETLSRILGVDYGKILEMTRDTKSWYKTVARRVEQDVSDQVREFKNEYNLKGVKIETDSKRYYPYSSLASHVVGFVGYENSGLAGLELSMDGVLTGSAGRVVRAKNAYGTDMLYTKYEDYYDAEDGYSVVTTIDSTIQHFMEKHLQQAVDDYGVKNGAAAIAMNVKTGEILGLVSLDNFDLNNFQDVSDKVKAEMEETTDEVVKQTIFNKAQQNQWHNKAVEDMYEPGSTFKPITVAMALEEGAVHKDDNFYCGGFIQVPGDMGEDGRHCWKLEGHGMQTLTQCLQHSCNVAMIQIAQKVGAEKFYEYVDAFGFKDTTGIELSGEAGSLWWDTELFCNPYNQTQLAAASFGQTFNITPLQLVRAMSACVNGGYLMQPYLVDRVIDTEGNTVSKTEPTVIRQVISEQTSEAMCDILEKVVCDKVDGTGKNAYVAGYRIGGKTGTSTDTVVEAQYGLKEYIVSFIGVAPTDDPQICILVLLDNPDETCGTAVSGGAMGAPTVGSMMADILPYLGVEPNYTEEELENLDRSVPDLTGMTTFEAQSLLEGMGLSARCYGEGNKVTMQLPAPNSIVAAQSQIVLYADREPPDEPTEMPDLVGLTYDLARQRLGFDALFICTNSRSATDSQTVVVSRQSIAPGEMVEFGTVVEVSLVDTDVNASAQN
ncbi:MAG: PASTA domain-containing protein [Ruminococcaceae bacterium]|nr:PASTA domain-containing protein [Oscillospiraceae bacterium]